MKSEMTGDNQAARLLEQAKHLVSAAKAAGAEGADAVVLRSRSLGIDVRHGMVEETDSSESDNFILRCFVGNRSASISANQATDAQNLAERAVAMAKVSPENPYVALVEPDLLAKEFPDIDGEDDTVISVQQLTEQAGACEAAALAVKGITNSGGASASTGQGGMVLVTSRGFEGAFSTTRYSCSVSVVAGEDQNMQRDYDYDSRIHYEELRSPQAIGKRAAERTVERLNPRQVKSQSAPVLFDKRVSSGLVGHFAGAINGASVARKTSFLREMLGEQVFAKGIKITDDPFRRRGQASRCFDGEGVAGEVLELVTDGTLNHWLLDNAAALELGLQTNGRANRGVGGTSPGSTNLTMQAGSRSPEEIMRDMGTGLLVTELIGQGVNMVSGDYSRGASGFWIENGEITFPVSEITIAGNMKDMFAQMEPASDLEYRFATNAPSILLEEMTIAGT